jgi:hypothetical protein
VFPVVPKYIKAGHVGGHVRVPRLVFKSKVSKSAERLQVNIPGAIHDLASYMLGKKVRVTLEVIDE